MWAADRLQQHKICGVRLVYKEVVEALSNSKKSYFWWFGNPARGGSTESNRTEKDQTRAPSKPVWGKRGEGAVWFSACGLSSDDWANGHYVDVFFTCGECGFSSLGKWSCSEERVWYLVVKNTLHCFREWDVRRVILPEFNMRYRLL